MHSWWWNRKNSTWWSCSLNTFCRVSRIWCCWSLTPSGNLSECISLPCVQSLGAGRAVTARSPHPAEQDVERGQGPRRRAPGQPGKSPTKTSQMFDFSRSPQHLGLTQSIAAFPSCLFFPPLNIWYLPSGPILSPCLLSLQCCVLSCHIITVQCLSNKLVANTK